MKISKQYYIFFLLASLIAPLGFLIRTLYSRTLTPAQVGLFYSTLNFFNIISIFATLGINGSLLYFVAKYNANNKKKEIAKIFQYTFFTNLILTTITFISLYILSPYIIKYYFHQPNYINSFNIFLFYFLFNNLLMILNLDIALKNNVIYQGLYFLRQFFIFLISITTYYFIKTSDLFKSYISIWVILSFLIYIFYIIYNILKRPYLFNIRISKFDKKLFRKLISYSFNYLLSGVGMTIFVYTDILVITYFLTMTKVAYYSNSTSIITFFNSIFATMSILLLPLFTELKEKKRFKEMRKVLDIIYIFFFFIIFPITLVLFDYSNLVIRLIFGEKYVSGAFILKYFSIFIFIKLILSYNLSLIDGLGEVKLIPRIIIPISLFNLLFDIFLIKSLNIYAPIISTILSWILIVISTYVVIARKVNYKLDFKKAITILILGILFLISLNLFKKIAIVSNFYINATFITSILYLIYLFIGNFIKIYTIEEVLILIPFKNIEKIILKIKKILPFIN